MALEGIRGNTLGAYRYHPRAKYLEYIHIPSKAYTCTSHNTTQLTTRTELAGSNCVCMCVRKRKRERALQHHIHRHSRVTRVHSERALLSSLPYALPNCTHLRTHSLYCAPITRVHLMQVCELGSLCTIHVHVCMELLTRAHAHKH